MREKKRQWTGKTKTKNNRYFYIEICTHEKDHDDDDDVIDHGGDDYYDVVNTSGMCQPSALYFVIIYY